MIQRKLEQKFPHSSPKLGVCSSRSSPSHLFISQIGNSFIDRSPDPLIRLGDYTLTDFETYFESLRKSEKYGRPQFHGHDPINVSKSNPTINIPEFFLSSQFTLSDPSTFNLVYPGIIPSTRPLSPTHLESTKSRTTSTSSDKSDSNIRRSSTTSNVVTKHSINSLTRLLQDKYTHYLDEVEVLITRALSTKSDCFHDAVRSHDEIQTFLHRTRQEIESLRFQLANYDHQSLLTILRLSSLLRQRFNQRKCFHYLHLLSIVKQTHSQVEILLKSNDYLSALDLIDQTKDILNTQLNQMISSRYFHQQLNELYSIIVNLIKQEFRDNLHQRLFSEEDFSNENDDDKFGTILIGLIRVKDEQFLEEIRAKFEQFLTDIISKSQSDSSRSHVNQFSLFIPLIHQLFKSTEEGLNRLRIVSENLFQNLSKQTEKQFPTQNEFFNEILDRIEDRLIQSLNDLFNHHQITLERFSIDEFAQFIQSIEQFIRNLQPNYSSTPLKTFLQSQTRKFLISFHNERKQRLSNTLDSDQWRQVTIPRSIQTSIDEFYSSTHTRSVNISEILFIENDQFVLSNSALHLFMLVLDYRSSARLFMKNSISDIENRLIELLNLFNSKTCQLVLGAGAVKLGNIRTISAKILAITCRCLQFIKILLPKIKLDFDQLKHSSSSSTISSISSAKQFEQLTKLYSEHIDEIHGKLITIIESTFGDTLSSYEVRAPMPSDCFRTLVTRHITAFYNAVAKIVSPSDLILLFTRLNSIFKQLLAKRLKQLKIANDGGPQHGLLTSDLLYYIKQVQSFPGLEMLELHVDEIWTNN